MKQKHLTPNKNITLTIFKLSSWMIYSPSDWE